MRINFYHLIRLFSSALILTTVSSIYPVFGQLVDLAGSNAKIILEETPSFSPEEEAFIGFTAREQTLASEGFEEFTLLSDRKENGIVEYAVSGRWGYLHICADDEVNVWKVKKAISKAFHFFDDIEGIILDIRFNAVGKTLQNEWLKYVYRDVFAGPVILLTSSSFSIPENWHHLHPWQNTPADPAEIVSTNLNYSLSNRNVDQVKDAVILTGLRKLRLPFPIQDFDAIW